MHPFAAHAAHPPHVAVHTHALDLRSYVLACGRAQREGAS